jgi:hypothetical protein
MNAQRSTASQELEATRLSIALPPEERVAVRPLLP